MKVSLQTRDPKEALRLARTFSHVAQAITDRGIDTGMRFEEIRAALKQHFVKALAQQKAKIAEKGRLSTEDVTALTNGANLAAEALTDDRWGMIGVGDDASIARLAKHIGLPPARDGKEKEMVRAEALRAYRDFCQTVLDYDRSLDGFSYESAPEAPSAIQSAAPRLASIALAELCKQFIAENIRGKRWGSRSLIEKRAHLALLGEILGDNTDAASLDANKARRVKEVLSELPKDRHKNPKTRKLSLADAIKVPGLHKLAVKTVNLHLTTYSSLFAWAKSNGYVESNVFEGMTIRERRKKSDGRSAFDPAQMSLMLDEILTNKQGLVRLPYQRWGTLIAMYTGARRNEIAQIHLKDIREEKGIWCFDLNDDDEGKQLKNDASRRLVPIHPRLIELGLLEHKKELEAAGQTKLFPSFQYCAKNGWGRNLGQWFNNVLLVKLGIKSKELVFHSLRHTVVTRLLQANIPEPVVKAIVGHAQAGVTQQHYFKEGYTLTQLSEALSRLDFAKDPAR